MPTWMIPWLFPLAIILLAIGFLISLWTGVAAVVIVLAAVAGGLRAYMRGGGTWPQWSGWRIQR